MSKEERLCPFKITTVKERNQLTGEETTHQRFEVCAGERCMAYGHGYKPTCLRIENEAK